MTIIIGLVEDSKVYMGADSSSSNGYTIRATGLRKVFARPPFLFGYCGSFRMGQLLEWTLQVPAQDSVTSDLAYMVTRFGEAVRKCLKDNGFARISSNEEEFGDFLVGYRGRLYHIESDLQVNWYPEGFEATGSGWQYALGAMAVMYDQPPKERILRALRTAGHYTPSVCGPYYVEVQE